MLAWAPSRVPGMPLTRPTPALPLVLAVLCHLPSLLSSLPPPPPPSPPPPRSPVHLHRCQEHHPKLHPPFSQSFPWLWTPGTGGGSGAWAGSPQGHHAFFALDPPVPRDPVRGGSGGVGGAVAEGEVLWPMGAKPGPGVGVPGSGATYCPRVSTARRQERLVTVVRVETNDPLRARLGTSGTAAATWTATLGFSDGRELHTMPLSAAAPTLVPPYGRPSYIDLLCMGSRDACTASTVRVTTARLGRAPDAERGDAGVHPPSSLPCASLESYVLPAQAVASDESLPTVMRWLSREGGAVLSHGSAASAKAAHAGPSQGNHGSGADIAGNLDGMGSTDNAGRVGGAGGAGSAGGDVDDGDGSDGSADDNDVTLCLQLSVDRLHKLLSICDQWRGPISAAVYIGPGGEEDIEWVLRAWLASPLMRRYVDIHLVTSPPRDGDDQQAASSSLGYLQQATQRRGRPAAATRPPLPSATPFVTSSIAPPSPLLPWAYPFNYLRNVAVKGSRTEWVVTLESDMAMPSHARQRMRRLIADPANQNQVSSVFYRLCAQHSVSNAEKKATRICVYPSPCTKDDIAEFCLQSNAWLTFVSLNTPPPLLISDHTTQLPSPLLRILIHTTNSLDAPLELPNMTMLFSHTTTSALSLLRRPFCCPYSSSPERASTIPVACPPRQKWSRFISRWDRH